MALPKSYAASIGAPRGAGQGLLPSVTLGNLTLSPLTATSGASYTGTISGKTAGSTIAYAASDGTVLTVSGTTVTGTFASAGTPTLTPTETLAGATNSPHISSPQTMTVSVPASVPVNSAIPVLSGNPGVASTVDPIVGTNGTWSNTPTSYAYQWQKNSADEAGQTTATYSGLAAIGDVVRLGVLASNAAGPAAGYIYSAGVTILAYMTAPTLSGTTGNYDAGFTGKAYRVDSPQGVTIGYWQGLTAGATPSLSSSGSNKVQLGNSNTELQVASAGNTATGGTTFAVMLKQVKASFADTYTPFTIKPRAVIPAGALTFAPRAVMLGDSISQFNNSVPPVTITSDFAAVPFSLSISTATPTVATASTASHGLVAGDPIQGTGMTAGTTVASVSGTTINFTGVGATATNATFKPNMAYNCTSGSAVIRVPFVPSYIIVGANVAGTGLVTGTVVIAQNGKDLTLRDNAASTQTALNGTWSGVAKRLSAAIGGELMAAQARKPNFKFDAYLELANIQTAAVAPPLLWGDNQGLASDHVISGTGYPGATARLVGAMARTPEILIISIGINDTGSSAVASTVISNITALVDLALTNYPSVRVILTSLRYVGISQLSTNQRTLSTIKAINTGLAAISRSRLQYADLSAYGNNPASGTAGTQTYAANETGLAINYETVGHTGDDVHPGGYGAELLGAPPLYTLIQANIDATVGNVLSGGTYSSTLTTAQRFFSGASGALAGTNGITGVIPAGWTASQGGANLNTVAFTIEANTTFDAAGQNIVATVTFQGSSTAENFNVNPSSISISAPTLNGQWVRAWVCVDVDWNAAWMQMQINLFATGQTANGVQFQTECDGAIYGDGVTGGLRERWFATPPFLMPAVNSFQPSFQIKTDPARATAGTTAVIKFKQFDLRKIDDPRDVPA